MRYKKISLKAKKVLKDLMLWNEKRLFDKLSSKQKIGYIKKLFLKEIITPKGLKIYAKEFKSGADVFISTAKNESNIALPIGKYPIGKGRFLLVNPEGIIKSIN